MPHLLRRLAVTAVLALLAVSVPVAAHAADADDTVTWMVRPSDGEREDGRSWVEQELEAGESVTEHLVVRNLSSAAVTFQLSAADGYFTDTGRFNMLTADQTSVGAGTWIEIQDTVDVPSGADVIVPFTVTVPDDATPGDHPAGVAAAIRSGGEQQVGVESRVGFRVMTRVTGELTPSVAASVQGTYQGSWNPFEPGRLAVDYSVANTGNTRLSVAPRITATALFGLVTFTVAGDEIVEIAPGETRSAAIRIPQAWPLFVYTAEVVPDTAVVGTGEDAALEVPPAEADAAIVAFPGPQLIALLIAAVLLWLLWRDRSRRERRLAEMLEQAREDGRNQAATPVKETATMRRTASALAASALLVAVGVLFTGSPASASTDEELSSIVIRVDVDPVVPTPSPTPGTAGSGGQGALPETGAPDLTALVFGGVAAGVLGAAALIARGRRGASGALEDPVSAADTAHAGTPGISAN